MSIPAATDIRAACKHTLMAYHYSDGSVIVSARPERGEGSVDVGVTLYLTRAEADEFIAALTAPEES